MHQEDPPTSKSAVRIGGRAALRHGYTQFIHNLKGNTQITRNVRQVTKSVDPKGQAIWYLPELYDALCQYFYSVYDTADHPALGQSPREAYRLGLETTGYRLTRLIAYDQSFLMSTLPATA